MQAAFKFSRYIQWFFFPPLETFESTTSQNRPPPTSQPPCPDARQPRIPSSYRIILDSMKFQPVQIWGFALIRCTYQDEARWKAFLSKIEEWSFKSLEEDGKPEETEILKQQLQITTIEDRPTLDSTTIQQASLKFLKWKESEGVPTKKYEFSNSPRWEYYIYVNEKASRVF